MACGLPAIVTSARGVADVVREGVNGSIVPPRNPDAIAEKLQLLATEECLRLEMGKAARITALQYNPENHDRASRKLSIERGIIR